VARKSTPEASRKQFAIGANVKLNAGGPVMAVKEYSFDGGIVCQWFSGKKLESGKFAPETLILVNNDAGQEKQPSAQDDRDR
jgi:uncharacterized protein YodC (DUF2158 family)